MSDTLTRADIAAKITSALGFSKAEAAELVDGVFTEITSVIKNKDELKISGFGNFSVSKKRERVGRNPKTGVSAVISARKVLNFAPSQILKQKINN